MLKAIRFQGCTPRSRQLGFSMIEVLVTIVVVAIGLLGLSGLQARTMVMEMESYQRGQALVLLQDLEDRVKSSRGDLTGPFAPGAGTLVIGQGAAGYNNPDVTATAPCGSYSGAQRQVCDWALMLKGASEKVSSSGVGAMLGARGCIVSVTPTQLNASAEFYLVVVWQGLAATSDPTSPYITNCASDMNFGAGMRRGVVTRVMVPKLSA